MNHPISRAQTWLLLVGCSIIASCSLQVPNENDVFGKNSVGGQTSGGYTGNKTGGSSSTAGNSAQSGGTAPSETVGGASTGGAGGASATTSGGSGASAGRATTGGSVFGGTTATGGSGVAGGVGTSTGGAGGANNTATGGAIGSGGTPKGGTSAIGGAQTGGTPAGGVATGGAPAGGIATGGSTTGPTVTGGAATGGSPTGGVATGGSPTGGVATGGSPTGGAPTGGAPPQVILQYNFEQGSGTTALDSTTNHNDGTLSNVSWSLTGRNGGSVNCATANSQIVVPSGLLGASQSLTVTAWVNLTANAAENRLFYFGTADGTSYFTLTLNNSVNGTSVRFKTPTGTEQVLTTPTQIPLQVWKHIAVSVSNVGAAMYIDGKIVAQDKTLVMDPTTLGTPMTNLVGSSPTAGQAFQGLIDEFYVYNGILALSDIRQLAWPKADYSIYHLDEGTGTSTADSSDNAINGTLVGAATWVPSPFGTGVLLANSPTVTPPQEYVSLGNGLVSNCTLNVTLAGWFKFTSNTTDASLLEFGKDTSNFVNIQSYSTSVGQAVFSFNFENTGAAHVVRARPYTGWSLGTWTHIAAIRSGTDGRPVALYQNGIKQVTGSTNTGALFNSWIVTTLNALGRATSDTIPGFDGAIDEVLVSCRAYTDDEIKQLAYVPPN